MFKSKKDKLDKERMKENETEIENLSEEKESDINKSEQEEEIAEEVNKSVSKENELLIQIKTIKDQLLRKAAEFENYKKRSENELSSFFKYANETLILDLLPVLDDFDRVFNSYNEKHDTETFKKGIGLIYEKLVGVLKKQGLKEMETNGQKFDFNLHDALLQIPDADHEANTIVETAEKGYFLKDKVIRHAKVVVSSLPDDKDGNNEEKKDDIND